MVRVRVPLQPEKSVFSAARHHTLLWGNCAQRAGLTSITSCSGSVHKHCRLAPYPAWLPVLEPLELNGNSVRVAPLEASAAARTCGGGPPPYSRAPSLVAPALDDVAAESMGAVSAAISAGDGATSRTARDEAAGAEEGDAICTATRLRTLPHVITM